MTAETVRVKNVFVPRAGTSKPSDREAIMRVGQALQEPARRRGYTSRLSRFKSPSASRGVGAMSPARELHQRLMNPPNAVHDDGIDLKRIPKKYTRPPQIVENIPLVVEPPIEVINNKSNIELEIEQLQARIDDLLAIATVRTSSQISVRGIQIAVAKRYDVRLLDLLSTRRTTPVVRARQIAMYLAKTLTLRTLPAVGRSFGRDHTTVLHAVRKITWLRQIDQKLDDDLRVLERAFTA